MDAGAGGGDGVGAEVATADSATDIDAVDVEPEASRPIRADHCSSLMASVGSSSGLTTSSRLSSAPAVAVIGSGIGFCGEQFNVELGDMLMGLTGDSLMDQTRGRLMDGRGRVSVVWRSERWWSRSAQLSCAVVGECSGAPWTAAISSRGVDVEVQRQW